MTTLAKDHAFTLAVTYGGDEDLSGATITLGIFATGTDWSKDLDTLLAADAEITKSTGDGDITITDGSAGTFAVEIGADDLATMDPGTYWVRARITTAGGEELGPLGATVEIEARNL